MKSQNRGRLTGKVAATVQAEKGHVDVLFANAGIGSMSPLGAITEEQFEVFVDGGLAQV